MTLLLQIADDRVTAKVTFAENFFDFKKILLLKGHLEQIICIVNLSDFHFSLSWEWEHLIFHEKWHVDWLFNWFECTCGLALTSEHVFDVSWGWVDERVVLIEASGFNFRWFFLLVHDLEVLCQHHNLSLSDHNEMCEILIPLNLLDCGSFSQGKFKKNFFGR